MLKYLLAAAAALTLAAPLAAQAQDAPSYAQPVQADEQVRGRVQSFDGGYNLAVLDERGFVDNVQLHQGTIINPTGITLAPGMVVSIIGYDEGSVLSANEIDTPYNIDAGVPYYEGQPWGYYGPSFTLGFFFGNVGWWHPDYFGGGFSYAGGVRVYNSINIASAGYGRGYGYGYGQGYGRNPGYGRSGFGQNAGGTTGYGYGHTYGGNAGATNGTGYVYGHPGGTTAQNGYRTNPYVHTYSSSQPAYREPLSRGYTGTATTSRTFGGSTAYRGAGAGYRSAAPSFHSAPSYHSSAPSYRSAPAANRGGGGGGNHERR